MPNKSARALSSIRAAMTNPPSVSRGLRGGVLRKSRASVCSRSLFMCSLDVRSLDLFGGYQHRGAFVLHEEHHEFRRFGLASVSSDNVNILRAFIEGLDRCESYFFPAPDLHYDRAFQHINKSMCVVAMYWVRAARRILNQEHQTFLPRKVRQVFRHELRQLRLLWFRRGGHGYGHPGQSGEDDSAKEKSDHFCHVPREI